MRFDETWHRLRDWTSGQAASERLAAQVLLASGFAGLDPSHPLGGPDGGADARCTKDGRTWTMAAHFPRGQQAWGAIKSKFQSDLDAARAKGCDGFAFVTNQELTLGEREDLTGLAAPTLLDLFHLERITALLDTPPLAEVRKQFLDIDIHAGASSEQVDHLHLELEKTKAHLEALQTGGDSFCYAMLYHFDMALGIAQQFVVIRKGKYVLHDVRLRILDMDSRATVLERPWGEINAPADFLFVKWKLPEAVYYRVFFHARNGSWTQDLILRRSAKAGCWLAATRVKARKGDVVHEQVDGGFVSEFSEPLWR